MEKRNMLYFLQVQLKMFCSCTQEFCRKKRYVQRSLFYKIFLLRRSCSLCR